MYHFFVAQEQIGDREIQIVGSDVNHIRNVLRMMPGEQISVSSREDGREYCCEIVQLEEKSVTARILQSQEPDTELPCRIYLFQGLPKGDKMELIIQKAVELGAYEIVPVSTKRTIVRLDQKKEEAKRRRWNAISESAAKQSKRTIVPEVKPVMTFDAAVQYVSSFERKYIPYELAHGMDETRRQFSGICPGDSIAVFIGPEGGFEESEIALAQENGIEPITLGKRILRTETAGMAVLSVLMYQMEGRS